MLDLQAGTNTVQSTAHLKQLLCELDVVAACVVDVQSPQARQRPQATQSAQAHTPRAQA